MGRRLSGSRSLLPPPDLEDADIADTILVAPQLNVSAVKQSPKPGSLLPQCSVKADSAPRETQLQSAAQQDCSHANVSQSSSSSPSTLRFEKKKVAMWSAHIKNQLRFEGHLEARDHRDVDEQCFLVGDVERQSIYAFNKKGSLLFSFGSDILIAPAGIAVLNDKILVTDSWMHSVFIFDFDGVMKNRFGHCGTGENNLMSPKGIAVGCNQEIYVADSSNNRVQVFSNNGTFLRSFGILGVRPGELDQPEDVAVDAARGRVAVAETGNARVQILNEVGSPLHIIKNFDWHKDTVLEHRHSIIVDQSGTVEELGLPAALAYTSSGLLLVTDVFYHRVLVFNTEWQAVQKFGAGGGWGAVDPWIEPYSSLLKSNRPLGKEKYAPFGGHGDMEFNCPRGIAVGSCGRIMVADSNNNRVQVFLS
eukprot:Tamp_01732.p2 GENE.Tamp_01732~~Tamp_01732.p2  ORF type:complete len:420 (+),score=57.09 Tamp_01732:2008-3267(+)